MSGGFNAFYFRGIGFPVSKKIFTVEVIMHVEYIDKALSSNSNGKFPPVNKFELDSVIDAAAIMPLYRGIRNVDASAQMLSRLGF